MFCLNAITRMPVIFILNSNRKVEAQVLRAIKAENNEPLIFLPGK